MSVKNLLQIIAKRIPCIPNIPEDSLRELIDSLDIEVSDDFVGIVISSNGTKVKFTFDSNGNFAGVNAKINSKNVPIIHGYGSKQLYIFAGPPTNTNPGVGWKVESALTQKYLNQAGSENNWEIFYASREAVINP